MSRTMLFIVRITTKHQNLKVKSAKKDVKETIMVDRQYPKKITDGITKTTTTVDIETTNSNLNS
jgi:hypothetical protein